MTALRRAPFRAWGPEGTGVVLLSGECPRACAYLAATQRGLEPVAAARLGRRGPLGPWLPHCSRLFWPLRPCAPPAVRAGASRAGRRAANRLWASVASGARFRWQAGNAVVLAAAHQHWCLPASGVSLGLSSWWVAWRTGGAGS